MSGIRKTFQSEVVQEIPISASKKKKVFVASENMIYRFRSKIQEDAFSRGWNKSIFRNALSKKLFFFYV